MVIKNMPFHKSRPYIIIVLLALILSGMAINLPIQPTGLIHSIPDEQGAFAFATGTYIGNGIVLTNWHVLKTLPSRNEYFKLPIWNEHIYNIDLPIEWVIFSEKGIDLAIGKLADSRLDRLNVDHACLSAEPVASGEVLMITSSPLGRYPPVEAHVVVTDSASQPRMDLDPMIKPEKRYAAVSFATIVRPGQEELIDSGSSGGAVANENGELVGLLWTRYNLPDGSMEVLVTPVSAWLPLLEKADIAPKYKEYILDQACK
jgi:hypothetical protein